MVIIGSRGSALVCALGAVINSAAPSFSQSVFLIGMSDQEVCERAIENSHWSSRPSARNFVEEAVARGYEVDDCVESINGSSEVARTDQNGDARTEVLEALRREEISDTAFAGIRNEVIQLYFMLERLGYTVDFSDDEDELFSRIRNALAGQRKAGLARLVDLRAEEIIVALRNEAWSERSSEFLENQENFVERSDLIQLQDQLNKLGFFAGPADGLLGLQTITAIEAFQAKYGMLIDGNPSVSVLITSALQLDFVQSGQKARGKPLRFLTWDGYIDDGLLFDFQQRFDIPIIYDSYGSEENLLSMLGSGLSYDVIINSIPHYLIENDYAAPVDLSKLSTWDEIDPMLQIMMPITDGVPTAMPYLWGTTGVAVNTNVVASFDAAPEKILNLFFEGSQLEKYQDCIFGVLDTLDSLYLFSRLDDRLVNALAASEYEVALDLLPAFAHNVELLSGDNWLDTQRRLATGELCAAVQYSGDVVNLQNDASHVDYIFPASGAGLWVDAISIGVSAEYDQSLRLVNFLSESENSAANVNWNSYASPNIFARNFIDPEILSNSAVYPAGVDMARFFSVPHEVSQDYIDIYQKFELLFSN